MDILYKNRVVLGHCKTCDSNSKTVLISSQDSRWIIVVKYKDGVLYFMFIYSLVVTQSLRIHNLMPWLPVCLASYVLMEYVWHVMQRALTSMRWLCFSCLLSIWDSIAQWEPVWYVSNQLMLSWMNKELAICYSEGFLSRVCERALSDQRG